MIAVVSQPLRLVGGDVGRAVPVEVLADDARAVARAVQATSPAWSSRAANHAFIPNCPPTVQTPLVWLYWPVRMLARLGQHQAFVTNALVKRKPCCTSSRCVLGMIAGVTVPSRWSSVTTSRTFVASGHCPWVVEPTRLPRRPARPRGDPRR